MKYDLTNNVDQTKFDFRVKQLKDQGKLVELKVIHPVRSNQQNRYLHVILGFFAVEYGETMEYIKTVFFKQIVNPEIFKAEYVNPKTGEVREAWHSSKDLTTAELTLAIDRFRDYASKEAGIYLPAPNEEDFLNHCEVEVSKNPQYV